MYIFFWNTSHALKFFFVSKLSTNLEVKWEKIEFHLLHGGNLFNMWPMLAKIFKWHFKSINHYSVVLFKTDSITEIIMYFFKTLIILTLFKILNFKNSRSFFTFETKKGFCLIKPKISGMAVPIKLRSVVLGCFCNLILVEFEPHMNILFISWLCHSV